MGSACDGAADCEIFCGQDAIMKFLEDLEEARSEETAGIRLYCDLPATIEN